MRGTDCQQCTVNMNNYKGNYITAKLTYKTNKKNETCRISVLLWQIRNPAIFSKIRPSPTLAKFITGFGEHVSLLSPG